MTDSARGLYLVDHRFARGLDGDLELLRSAIADACVRISESGAPVSVVSCLYLPESSRLLCLFSSEGLDPVERVIASVQIVPCRVEAGIEVIMQP